jgi:hypothetical protein
MTDLHTGPRDDARVPQAELYRALDEVLSAPERGIPQGRLAAVGRSIEALRQSRDDQRIREAEEISITLHRLQCALAMPGERGRQRVRTYRAILSQMAKTWLGSTYFIPAHRLTDA